MVDATPVLSIVQISDTHLAEVPGTELHGVDTDRSLAAVLARAAERNPRIDLVLATGDLVHDAPGAYRRLRTALESLPAPACCLPGNHDDPAAMRARLDGERVGCPRQVVLGRWQIVLLDSVVPGTDGGHLGASELARLDAALGERPGLHAMIALHHQPVPIGSAGLDAIGADNGEALFDVLQRHPQVRGVVWGHIHQEFIACRRGLLLAGAPSTCVQFRPRADEPAYDDQAPGYRRLELHPDGTIITAIDRVAVERD